MGSSDQVGNELDEFVIETLRNNLLGLPLDLPAINMTRARDVGVPPLNQFRRQVFAQTNDGQLAPYTSWSDFGQHLKHPESLINFVAAYGLHPTITGATTLAGKRAAARAIVDPLSGDVPPADAADFMFSTGAWATAPGGLTITGLDNVDMWVGGLAEITNLFGGLLGTTFNYVFQLSLENLQESDRFYYLARTPGMNLRTQLEGNSFAELIQRNTDGTNTLKADAFATADCKFQLGRLTFPAPAGSFNTGPGSIADDPLTTDCDENLLLLRNPTAPSSTASSTASIPAASTARPSTTARLGLIRCSAATTTTRSGAAPARTSSRATAVTTSPSVATTTTSSPISAAPTSSRAVLATMPSTPESATTSAWAARARTS